MTLWCGSRRTGQPVRIASMYGYGSATRFWSRKKSSWSSSVIGGCSQIRSALRSTSTVLYDRQVSYHTIVKLMEGVEMTVSAAGAETVGATDTRQRLIDAAIDLCTRYTF